jgi:ATP-dependent DNA helicase RecG
MQFHIVITNREYFRKNILKPLLESGQLQMTIPDKPNSRNQKYVKINNNFDAGNMLL